MNRIIAYFKMFFKYGKNLSKFNNNKTNRKLTRTNKFIIIFCILISILLFYIIISKFSILSILICNVVFNLYVIYFFILFYPKERLRYIKYINKVLKEKKESYILELEKERTKFNNKEITKLILKDDENYDIEFFDISNSSSVLIGKNNDLERVDIDFSNHEYSHLVSRIHGVLNKVDSNWYYEDLNSKNGSGIEKKNRKKEKLSSRVPYLLESGDIIYIGIIKILLN